MSLPPSPPGLVVPAALVAELEAAYRAPPRVYHVFAHACAVARWTTVAVEEAGLREPREAYVAALFHDAIYDVACKDNEARSAALAREASARYRLPVDAERVARLVERTAEHGRARDLDPDEALFLDCDVAVLGGSAAEYDAYEAGVAAEYARSVPGLVYRVGRRRFLERLLASPRIYASDYFHARLEALARENLRRALAAR